MGQSLVVSRHLALVLFTFICKMFTFAEAFPPTSLTTQLPLPLSATTQSLRVLFQTGMLLHWECVDTH